MRKVLFLWFLIVILACGAGASVHFLEGWIRIATLVAVSVVCTVVVTITDYKMMTLYAKDLRNARILYVSTAVIAACTLLACMVEESSYLTELAVATIPLIAISIRRALQPDE
jgi:hypothetical protein